VVVSWWFTRRLTRPLAQLRDAIEAQDPAQFDAAVPAALPAASAPELKAIDQVWRELLTRYRQHESERALLLAGVSHDLRSPLARIRLAAEMLPEAAATRRETIERNVRVADGLIESFLAHVRSGELPLDERCDVAAIARGVAERCAPLAPELRLPAHAWIERANGQLIERLIANLVDNALRHGAPPVLLEVQTLAQAVRITVQDHGSGLPAALQGRPPQAFARGDTSRGSPGSGLGLAIVARTVARLSGTLVFEKTGNQPHRVAVTLPSQRYTASHSNA
jgi:two-component system, OmpR family, osmolarity sensor histidine kinase EnvZ